jgi:hypothetical protein
MTYLLHPQLICDKPRSRFLLILEFNSLQAMSNLNYMQAFRSYRAVNILHLDCENQPVSAVRQ